MKREQGAGGRGQGKTEKQELRGIPAVEVMMQKLSDVKPFTALPRALVLYLVRDEIQKTRKNILKGKTKWDENAFLSLLTVRVQHFIEPSIKKVINATGVVLHTNLGRAPLSAAWLDALKGVSEGYSALEYDIEKGERGSRHAHVGELVKYLSGAEDGFAVNNNAAAVLLVLNTMAEGREVLISRGELVEIGASFRIPDIMQKSGAILKEVGTTNKTKLSDYERAVTKNTGIILKVHQSNFHMVGFTQSIGLKELVSLGKKYKLPVVEDLGSGCLFDLSPHGLQEPTVMHSVKNGADVVTFSGDKLLGGPQAGIIAGKAKPVERLKKNPLARAVRIDKLSLCALENTLRAYCLRENARETIPVLNMLTTSLEALQTKAERLAKRLEPCASHVSISLEKVSSVPGGGALPDVFMESWAVSLEPRTIKVNALEKQFRRLNPPIIARIEKNRVLLDVRTIFESEFEMIQHGVEHALKS